MILRSSDSDWLGRRRQPRHRSCLLRIRTVHPVAQAFCLRVGLIIIRSFLNLGHVRKGLILSGRCNWLTDHTLRAQRTSRIPLTVDCLPHDESSSNPPNWSSSTLPGHTILALSLLPHHRLSAELLLLAIRATSSTLPACDNATDCLCAQKCWVDATWLLHGKIRRGQNGEVHDIRQCTLSALAPSTSSAP
jgi:hypothetical protein